jgi:cbb3-type cytochrome oxidase subunit 3
LSNRKIAATCNIRRLSILLAAAAHHSGVFIRIRTGTFLGRKTIHLFQRASIRSAVMHNLLIYGIPIAFIVLVLYVFRPSARKRYQADARIPLDDNKRSSSR